MTTKTLPEQILDLAENLPPDDPYYTKRYSDMQVRALIKAAADLAAASGLAIRQEAYQQGWDNASYSISRDKPQPSAKVPEDERKAFEHFVLRQRHWNESSLALNAANEYLLATIQLMWMSWSERAAHAASAQSAQVAQGELPPLPEHDGIMEGVADNGEWGCEDAYSADQMRAYGRACAEVARQPAPALPVKTWQERAAELPRDQRQDERTFMRAEIEDLRAARAAINKG